MNAKNEVNSDLFSELLPQATRSSLLPRWFHVLMGIMVIFYGFCMATAIVNVWDKIDLRNADEATRWNVFSLYILLLIMLCNIAGCILIWCKQRSAVIVTVGPAILFLLLLFLGLLVCILEPRSRNGLYFVIPVTLIHIVFTVRLFIILKRWKEGSR